MWYTIPYFALKVNAAVAEARDNRDDREKADTADPMDVHPLLPLFRLGPLVVDRHYSFQFG